MNFSGFKKAFKKINYVWKVIEVIQCIQNLLKNFSNIKKKSISSISVTYLFYQYRMDISFDERTNRVISMINFKLLLFMFISLSVFH